MANFVYDGAKRALLAGEIDFDANTFKMLLLMDTTTADTEKDKTTVSGFTTLAELAGAGYARQTLAGKAVATDSVNHRGEFTMTDVTFANVSAGASDVQGALLIKFVTNDADSIPIAFIDTAGALAFPLTPNGGSIIVAANVEGLVQAT